MADVDRVFGFLKRYGNAGYGFLAVHREQRDVFAPAQEFARAGVNFPKMGMEFEFEIYRRPGDISERARNLKLLDD